MFFNELEIFLKLFLPPPPLTFTDFLLAWPGGAPEWVLAGGVKCKLQWIMNVDWDGWWQEKMTIIRISIDSDIPPLYFSLTMPHFHISVRCSLTPLTSPSNICLTCLTSLTPLTPLTSLTPPSSAGWKDLVVFSLSEAGALYVIPSPWDPLSPPHCFLFVSNWRQRTDSCSSTRSALCCVSWWWCGVVWWGWVLLRVRGHPEPQL